MGIGGFRLALLLGASSFGLLASLGAARAQAVEQTELAPVIVQGKKKENAPVQKATKTEIGRAVLQDRMVDSVEDVGRRVDAGVNFNTNNKSINLRGLDNDRVLTTIDGIRVPWLADPRGSARGGLNTFDFDALSRFDIDRGANSSRYGSGALGGVVQLQTLNPEDLIEDGKSFGGIVKGAYNSGDEGWRTNAAVAGRVNDTWLMMQGGYRRGHETANFGTAGGYGSERTEPNPLDYDQKNALVKLHQYFDGGHRFGLTGEMFDRKDEWDNMSATTSSYVPNSFVSGDITKRNRISGEYNFVSPDRSGFVDRAKLIGYWQSQELHATTDAIRRGMQAPTGPYMRDNELEQKGFGFTGDAEKTVELGGLAHTFRFGAEARKEGLTQYSAGLDNCPAVPPPFSTCSFLSSNHSDMPDVESKSMALFIEDDVKLYDGRLTITPGVRFDWYDHSPSSTAAFERSSTYDPAFLIGNSDSNFSPKLRAAFQASEKLELYAQWAQGFKAPSALELYGNYGNFGNYVRLGNPDLKPETSNGFEVGGTFTEANYSVSVSAFANRYENFIETIALDPPPPGYFQGFGAVNIPDATIYGAELRGQVNINANWRSWGSVAFAQGQGSRPKDGEEFRLSSVAPFKAILGLGYEAENWGADVSTTLVASRQYDSGIDDDGFKAPGYGLVDATIWWSPAQLKGFKLQAGVYNILDQKYWNVTDVPNGTADNIRDRFSEPGRTFRLAVSQKF